MTMNRFISAATGILLMLSLSFATFVPRAHGLVGNDPNSYKEGVNFRRTTESRYRRTRRFLERQRLQETDDAAEEHEDIESFDARAKVLREAQQRKTQKEVDERTFSGERREGRFFWDRDDRTNALQIRRIRRAERTKRLLPKRIFTPHSDAGKRTSEVDIDRLFELRERRRAYEQERARRDRMEYEACDGLTRSRLTLCRYRNDQRERQKRLNPMRGLTIEEQREEMTEDTEEEDTKEESEESGVEE